MPTDKKRESVRFAIRMKMFLSSGIEFPNPLDAVANKKKANNNAKIADKVTKQNIKELNEYIKLNSDMPWPLCNQDSYESVKTSQTRI